MRLKQLGSNRVEIALEDSRVLISYEPPVAAWIAGVGYVKTEKKWSRTTSKHITQWAPITETRPQAFFDHLLEQTED